MTTPEEQTFAENNKGFVRCKMNDDAELYNKSNNLQTRDAILCLQDYSAKLKWRDGDRILDIGCADGRVTKIITKYIPVNYEELVGCDINDKMIQFANEKFKNEKISFKVLDIEGDLPEEFKGAYNHVMSFYVLHWIKNQEKAFTNIFDILSEGGDCLLSLLAYMPVYTAFWAVANTAKWKKWIPSCEGFISPYHKINEPENYIAIILRKIGFKNIDIRCKQKYYYFDSLDSLKDTVRAINPFPVPEDIFEDFLNDYLAVWRGMQLMDSANNDNNLNAMIPAMNYNLLIIHATKP